MFIEVDHLPQTGELSSSLSRRGLKPLLQSLKRPNNDVGLPGYTWSKRYKSANSGYRDNYVFCLGSAE